MNKKLLKLPEETLLKIASNLGRPQQNKLAAIKAIQSVCKDYSFNYSDLRSRFNLPK